MPSWLILSLIVVAFFILALLASERLALLVTRRSPKREAQPAVLDVAKKDGRPDGW